MFLVISENFEGGYTLSFHEHDGMPAYKEERYNSIKEAKKAVAHLNITWREPDEEADADVVLIGY